MTTAEQVTEPNVEHGETPTYDPSTGWLHWVDMSAGDVLAMDVRGSTAPLTDDKWTYRFLRARANSIEGGTTEILKNIIAERVLGLPKLR